MANAPYAQPGAWKGYLKGHDQIRTTYQGLTPEQQAQMRSTYKTGGQEAASTYMRGLDPTKTASYAQPGAYKTFMKGHEKIAANVGALTPDQQKQFRTTFKTQGRDPALTWMRGLNETPGDTETPADPAQPDIIPPENSQPVIDMTPEQQQAQTDFLYPKPPGVDAMRGDITADIQPFDTSALPGQPGALNLPGQVQIPGRTNVAQVGQFGERMDEGRYDTRNYIPDLNNNPMYNWRMQTGQDALNKKLAALGLGDSGAALQQTSDLIAQIGAEESDKMWQRAADTANRAAQVGQANLAAGLQARGQDVQTRGQDISAGTAERGQDISSLLQGRGQDINAAVAGRGQDISARGQDIGAMLQGRGQDVNAQIANAGNMLSAYGQNNQLNQANANRGMQQLQFDTQFGAQQNQNQFNNLMGLVNTAMSQNPVGYGLQAAQTNASNYQNLGNQLATLLASNYPQMGGGGGGGGGGSMPYIPPYASQPSMFPSQLASIFGGMANSQGQGNMMNDIFSALPSIVGGIPDIISGIGDWFS